jgi:hypothetical protein
MATVIPSLSPRVGQSLISDQHFSEQSLALALLLIKPVWEEHSHRFQNILTINLVMTAGVGCIHP